uniref:WD repeat-containing protein 76 n=1 Tax=Jaculus jaculus TaxID=51337 RepID=A0A8C5LIY9_JACJA
RTAPSGESEKRAGAFLCVNECKENENSTTTLGKTLKVYLSPISLSNYKLDPVKWSTSVLEKNSNHAVVSKKTEVKTYRKILTPKMKAISFKSESTLQKSSLDVHAVNNKVEHKSNSESGLHSVDTGSSDEDTTPGLDEFAGLSPYERKRLKNIKENANFFASLQLSESAARLREMIKKKQPTESKRKKPKKKENEIGCRRSMRLLKVDPLRISLPEASTQLTLVEDENPLLPPGPLEMIPENQDDNNELFKGFLKTWAETSKVLLGKAYIKNLLEKFLGMGRWLTVGSKCTVNKCSNPGLHPYFVFSLTPNSFQTQQKKEDGAYSFHPHSQTVSCLYFSPTNPAHLLSLSYDGTLRCGDFSSAVFEEVYRNERSSFSSFDFLTEDASTLLVGHWDGHLSLVDRRTPGTSYEKLFNSSMGKIRTVHVHPVLKQYFITAGLRDIHIYDTRRLNSRGSQPLISLHEHTKSIASAYFSPVTGNRVVTTCADSKLRVFDSSCISSQIPLLTTIRHNTITGRWLTRFQAMWDPKQEDCFLVGSMAHPRQVDIFHETGRNVHSFFGDCLLSVCSLSVMHPTRYILAGGNSSGKLHVFINEGSC